METIKITKGDFLKNAGIVGMWNMLLVSDAKQGVNEDFWLDEEEQVLCISGEFAKNADWTDLYFKASVSRTKEQKGGEIFLKHVKSIYLIYKIRSLRGKFLKSN